MDTPSPCKRSVAVLRPEPGNAATAARLERLGLTALRMPVFHVVACDWTPPPADRFDALLLTSANTVRHAGAGLSLYRQLPVVAVGATTATAAEAAGFVIAHVGTGDAVAATRAAGFTRLLHLGGRDRTAPPGVAAAIAVYASEGIAAVDLAGVAGQVAMLHSVRAAQALAAAGLARGTIRLAALSNAVATAAGPGWAQIAVAPQPTDAALVEIAHMLAIDQWAGAGDKAR